MHTHTHSLVRTPKHTLTQTCVCVCLAALQTREMASGLAFQKHVVACVFGDRGSRLLGLRAFMMPLRASSLTRPELPPVVFLGDRDYFLREWPDIHYFPHIYFLPVSVRGGTWVGVCGWMEGVLKFVVVGMCVCG